MIFVCLELLKYGKLSDEETERVIRVVIIAALSDRT